MVDVAASATDQGVEGEDPDLVPLSALQHFLFCPRQCALIHVEQAWAENLYTAEGRLLHEATAAAGIEKRRGVRTIMAMPLASSRLGVSGIADVVEMHEVGGAWRPFPVEYKRGKPKAHRADEVQLCAQAMALEEMFDVALEEGGLFYGETRRRTTVALDANLRRLTKKVAADVREMLTAGKTPQAVYDKRKCKSCSLVELCRPQQLANARSAASWLSRQLNQAE
jgi:CRISPR-associated exonuclease Cas4